MVVVCWVAALVACVGYGVASVLQSVGARRVTEKVDARVRLGVIAAILTQVPYLLGLALDGFAFVANAVALQRLPLYLVQAVVSASVGVTALIAWRRGAHVGGPSWVALGALGAGLVLVTLGSGSEAARAVPPTLQWVILTAGLLPLALAGAALRARGGARPAGLAVASGLAFTGVAVAARVLVVPAIWWHLAAEPLLWAIIVHGILGTVLFAVALQHGSVTEVTAITFAVELVVPAVIGVVALGDTIAPGGAWAALLGLVLTLTSTVVLARLAAEQPTGPASSAPS